MITVDSLKNTLQSLGYKWLNGINIIGIRTTLQVPDVFNDLICVVVGNELKVYTITTEPGVAHQKKLLNTKGCAVLKPGQYIDAYAIGFHQNKPDHEALVQVGKVTVVRDADLDGVAGNNGTDDTGLFGINIHGANKMSKTEKIGAWSAGCQVFHIWKEKEDFISICKKNKPFNNLFPYTLINEKDLK